MQYTVIFLFNMDLSKVLLIQKDRGEFFGKWNGVGGKVELGETFEECAIRETLEEAGVDISNSIKRFIRVNYFSGTEIGVYCAKVLEWEVRQIESEQQRWFSVHKILTCNVMDQKFASNGNVPYYVYNCRNILMKEGA